MVKCTSLLILLTFSNEWVEAKKVSGFIITENSDTLYGKIIVSKINLYSGGLFINGINLEPLHFEVFFKESETKQYISYKATDILEFGFKYKLLDYKFKSFTLESNTPVVSEKQRERFLQLCYAGKVSLYKEVFPLSGYNKKFESDYKIFYYQSFMCYDYFLYTQNVGLTKVEKSKDIETMNDLLYFYGFEQEFVEKIPKNTKFKDIMLILIQHEIWSTNRVIK